MDDAKTAELEQKVTELRTRNEELEARLWSIENTLLWRAGQYYYKLVERIPLLKRSLRLGRKMASISIKRVRNLVKKKKGTPVSSAFNPYNAVDMLKPIEVVVDTKRYTGVDASQVSLITTILNEASHIEKFLTSLEAQTVLPGEVIIVDGGSTDKTVALVERFSRTSKLSIVLVTERKVNIAQGRNIAIQQAKNELVLCTDVGCILDPQFVANMVGAFQNNPDTDLVGGTYIAQASSAFGKFFIPNFETFTEWDTLLPSGRAVLIKKSVWQKAGGYPEFLTSAGEDTLFDINYRQKSQKWVFSTRAVVHWHAPELLSKAKALFQRYGRGDGESGIGDFYYYNERAAEQKGSPYLLGLWTGEGYIGYKFGRANRGEIDIHRRKIPGVMFILAGVPITDSGCGQRCAQLAKEYIRQGYRVIYVNLYPSYEEVNKQYVDVDLSLLELYYIDDVPWKELVKRYESLDGKIAALIEFPHPKFLEITTFLKKHKVKLIYDYIDNWNSSLGGNWYSPDTDHKLLQAVDCVIASAKTLKDDLATRTPKDITLVPNSVNTFLFDPLKTYEHPDDIPTGKPIVMYIGALWGEWFDWDVFTAAVEKHPEWNFVLVGGGGEWKKEQCKKYKNVFFVGLKPQSQIPAYLSCASVCIIPFKVDNISKYVSPLKVYEYLAMHKPVVSMAMPELAGLPYTYIAQSPQEFEIYIAKAMHDTHAAKEFETFITVNNWQSRVAQIQEMVGF